MTESQVIQPETKTTFLCSFYTGNNHKHKPHAYKIVTRMCMGFSRSMVKKGKLNYNLPLNLALHIDSVTDVSAGFRPPCWCPSKWAPTWRLHTNLYKFGKNVSPHIFHKKNCCDLNLGESLCISTFFLFPDSGLKLLNDFDFLF